MSCTHPSSCRNTFLALKIASSQDAGRCKKLISNFTLISRASNAVSLSEDSPAHNIPFVIDSSLLYEVLCRLKSEAWLAGWVSFVVNFSSSSHHRVVMLE